MSIDSVHAYRFGYLKSEQWQRVRLDALVREKGKCQICGEESISNDAHHIWYPESIYDTTERNLVILCRDCHQFLHTMTPECKTKDEREGIVTWNKLRKSITHWRKMKDPIFQNLSDLPANLNASELRNAYDNLKGKAQAMERLIDEYRNRFGDINDPQLYHPVKSINAMNVEQQWQFINSTIKTWMKAYSKSKPDSKLDTDNV